MSSDNCSCISYARMSHKEGRSETRRLPPIGFEGLSTDQPVKPLKKKKKRGRNKLQTIVDVDESFSSAG